MFDAREIAKSNESGSRYQPFPFTGLDGEQYELPHPMTLTEAQSDEIGAGGLKTVLADIAPEALDAINAMPLHVSKQLCEEWLELGGDEGKSPLPSPAPNRAARRSKRTSQSAASS